MNNICDMELSEMAGLRFECDCGRKHSVDIQKIIIDENIIDKILNFTSNFSTGGIFILADNNTYKVYARKVEQQFLNCGFIIKTHIFDSEHQLIPDEKALGRLMVEIENDTGLIVAIGSGTLNDLARVASFKLKIPYIILGTAPSMDGYASTVSPLIINGIKTTYEAVYPNAVMCDLEVLKQAPYEMLTAGFGDVLGKYTALADWELARRQKGEYYCDLIVSLVTKALGKCIDNIEGISRRKGDAIKYLTEALVLSGVAMGLSGNSRPASGAEHHLAHFWEMNALKNHLEHPLHGNSVGVGTVISASIYKMLKQDFALESNVPEPEHIASLLKKIGAFDNPSDLGIRREVFRESVIHAMKIRPRYTVFHYAKEKGVLERYADVLLREFY